MLVIPSCVSEDNVGTRMSQVVRMVTKFLNSTVSTFLTPSASWEWKRESLNNRNIHIFTVDIMYSTQLVSEGGLGRRGGVIDEELWGKFW